MIQPDPWLDLRAHTAARLAPGRTGSSLPTREILRFGLAHAQARDAVLRELDVQAIAGQLQDEGPQALQVQSAAGDRSTYLLRPDLGRRLSEPGRRVLQEAAGQATARQNADDRPEGEGGRHTLFTAPKAGSDLLLVVADGLSAPAIERNALPMLAALRPQVPTDWRIGPVVIATQARVALGDEIGELLATRLVAVLIGERPGLSSPDSLGIYLTWRPHVGRIDAERNCISNIRPEGLGYDAAAHRFWWLCQEARQLGLTGVRLKDRSDPQSLANSAEASRIA